MQIRLTSRAVLSGALPLAVVLLNATATFAQGCPMCKDAARAAGDKFTNGLDASILSLFFLPFLLGSVISSVVFKAWWNRTHPENNLSFPKAMLAAYRERKNRI